VLPYPVLDVIPVVKSLPAVVIGAIVIALTGCSSGSPSPAISYAPPVNDSTPVAPGPVASLGPLTLGNFPSTVNGNLAKAICTSWAGLRHEYVQKITVDTAYQMNGWFSSADWSKIQNDSMALGNDQAYSNLETALGVGMTGEDASAASAAALDKACEAAD